MIKSYMNIATTVAICISYLKKNMKKDKNKINKKIIRIRAINIAQINNTPAVLGFSGP